MSPDYVAGAEALRRYLREHAGTRRSGLRLLEPQLEDLAEDFMLDAKVRLRTQHKKPVNNEGAQNRPSSPISD